MPNTSHYRIFDYWKDKIITSSGDVMDINARKSKLEYEFVIDDWGEPSCWACGELAIGDDALCRFFDAHQDAASEDFYKKLYALKPVKSKLNRCHIKPNALGGEDSPENLFLMCEECHVLSPDTTNRAAFLRWVYDRKQRYTHGVMAPREMVRRINDELSRRGLPDLMSCIGSAKSTYPMSDIYEFMRENVGSHCSQVVESTIVVAATDWILHDLTTHLLDLGNESYVSET